jgi:hypothetical protein
VTGKITHITSAAVPFGKKSGYVIYIVLALVLSGCATQSYHYESTNSYPIRERAVRQTQGDITVSASVPGEDEAKAIFGIPIYKRGIQPVWLEIMNNTSERVRFAPTGVDRNYFSPLEVAYMHRKGFSKQARAQMEKRFYHSAIPRQIPAGETRSGYVFTNARPGTKSFDVDIFSAGRDQNFAFFVTVPGFVPDHENVDFESLYERSEVRDYALSEMRAALSDLPWFSTNQSGEQPGLPVGVVIIAPGIDVLKALLRAGWYESPKMQEEEKLAKAHYLFGRIPDAVFRIQRQGNRDRNELNLWLAPMRIEGEAVWLGQLVHFIGQRTQLEQAIFGARVDPDVDDGRNYLMQNVWYSQGLEQVGWLAGGGAVSIETARFDFNSLEYFTDGYRSLLWLSGEPVSLLETRNADLDDPPFK